MAQFEHSGRYPDLMNPEAIKRFLELMHTEFAKEAGELFSEVKGFYTNEPNLMQLPWNWRDQSTRKYAFLAFNEALPRNFKQMHGYDLMPHLADYKPSVNLWPVAIRSYADRQLAWQQTEHALLDNGIDYLIIHPEGLTEAAVSDDILLTIGSGSFRYLVMPQVEFLSLGEMQRIKEFEAAGGKVFWVDSKPVMGAYKQEDRAIKKGVSRADVLQAEDLSVEIQRLYSNDFHLELNYGNQDVATARFSKDGNCLYYLVNRGENPVTIDVRSDQIGVVELFNPKTGENTRLSYPYKIEIKGFDSMIVVHPQP